MKKFVASLILLSFIAALLAACSGTSGNCGSSSSDSTPAVQMCGNTFAQSSITISKGQSLTLANDASDIHIIANGSWINSTAESRQEPGAPVVNNLQFNGNASHIIGPFNTAGTYHLYCTVHPGMNLTVIVQ